MGKKKEETDLVAAEIERLAEETPSRFSLMKITDKRTGLLIEVDQSLDSTFKGKGTEMKMIMIEFANLYFQFKIEPYKGEFNGLHKIMINNLLIDFGSYEGEKAYNWLKRYINVVMDLMNREGLIDLNKMEEEFNGRYRKSKGLEQPIQEQNPKSDSAVRV